MMETIGAFAGLAGMSLAGIIGLAVFGIGIIVFVVMYFFAIKLQIKLFEHWLKNGQRTAALIYIFATMVVFWFGFSTIIAYLRVAAKLSSNRDKIHETLVQNPSDENVDVLIEDIERFGCPNTPNDWNKLRAVWISVNESPNVTTEKKKQLKQLLMLKGLNIYHNDARIIDNYNG